VSTPTTNPVRTFLPLAFTRLYQEDVAERKKVLRLFRLVPFTEAERFSLKRRLTANDFDHDLLSAVDRELVHLLMSTSRHCSILAVLQCRDRGRSN